MFGADEAHKLGRVSNGQTWTDVLPEKPVEPKKKMKNPLSFFRRRSSLSSAEKDETPVAPIVDGNGKIIVTIPTFRDGQKCGENLLGLFQNAKNPDNIVVSLVEQQNESDTYCVEAFCKAAANVDIIERQPYLGGHKVYTDEEVNKKCPRLDQIRSLRIQDSVAKGPPWARAIGRRSLGNEEFCLQTSTHATFALYWDLHLLKEWKLANNEFAVLSHPLQGSLSTDTSVPRTCGVNFLKDERLPHYESEPDGKAEKLKKPLLAHAWAPGFSFSKCHLEEAAPSDGFLPYVSSNIEAFARYARMWSRGYDVYTPTANYVFGPPHTNNPHKMEWIENWKGRKSLPLGESLKRLRSYLEIPDLTGNDATAEKLDNLGIYGIGKRRTLKQLQEFVGIDLQTQQSRAGAAPCGNYEWVPYDSMISPMDNLYSNPDNLDAQPEFPLRTKLTFDDNWMGINEDLPLHDATSPLDASRVPYGTLFVLWVLGLGLWCFVHVISIPDSKRKKRRINKNK